MIIGIDFDNTIISYERLFSQIAETSNLVPKEQCQSKNDIRNYLRKIGQEDKWTELQGIVYGKEILQAKPYSGVIDFLIKSVKKNISVFIISHKTKYSKKGVKYDLHKSALDWLYHNSFFSKETGLTTDNVFFNPTREEKIQKIMNLKCDIFIDDLPEIFNDLSFLNDLEKILFDPTGNYKINNEKYSLLKSWNEISEYIFNSNIGHRLH